MTLAEGVTKKTGTRQREVASMFWSALAGIVVTTQVHGKSDERLLNDEQCFRRLAERQAARRWAYSVGT